MVTVPLVMKVKITPNNQTKHFRSALPAPRFRLCGGSPPPPPGRQLGVSAGNHRSSCAETDRLHRWSSSAARFGTQSITGRVRATAELLSCCL